jgi:hypothetical protein
VKPSGGAAKVCAAKVCAALVCAAEACGAPGANATASISPTAAIHIGLYWSVHFNPPAS